MEAPEKNQELKNNTLEYTITTSEHAFEYGIINAVKPLYLKRLYVDERCRNKGQGSNLLKEAENYAKQNGCDVIFGHIVSNAEFTPKKGENIYDASNVKCIKIWLLNRNYAINTGHNGFHKYIKINIMTSGQKEEYKRLSDLSKDLNPNESQVVAFYSGYKVQAVIENPSILTSPLNVGNIPDIWVDTNIEETNLHSTTIARLVSKSDLIEISSEHSSKGIYKIKLENYIK